MFREALLRLEQVAGPLSPRAFESHDVPAEEVPIVGRVISITLSLITLSVIAICLSRRIPITQRWKKLPITSWIIIITYVDSFIFVFLSAIIKDLGVNNSLSLCQGAILLCLSCYLTTKIFIYIFLVEKAYIVRGTTLPRYKDKVYLFNTCGLMLPYLAIAIMNFVYRIGYINENGRCIIGMEKISLIPLISFDVLINVYLTALFLVPLRRLYSFQNHANHALRTMALRTFIGTCCTLLSSVVNLTVLTVLKGEPGWICLLACNADVLFSVLVLHWVTVADKKDLVAPYGSSHARSRNRCSLDYGPKSACNTRGMSVDITTKDKTFIRTTVGALDDIPGYNGKMQDITVKGMKGCPNDAIHVRTDYVQEVEMEGVSSGASETYSEHGRSSRNDYRSASTEAIV